MKMPTPASEFKPLAAGTHLAVCYQVVDLGTQEDTYEGRTNVRPKVWLGFEVPGEKMSDGRNFVVGKEFSFSASPKSTFRKYLETWRGVPFKDSDFGPDGDFDVKNLIGAGCMLSVVHNANGRAVIQGIMALPGGTKVDAPEKEVYLSFEDGFDQQVFDGLQDWMQQRIMDSPEYQQLNPVADEATPF